MVFESVYNQGVVLILVLMEDTLREKKVRVEDPKNRLNPCFNGRYSQSERCSSRELCSCVLILVLMEDTLRVGNKRFRLFFKSGLNPCFNGRYSQRAKTYVPLYTSIWGMFKLLETLLLT